MAERAATSENTCKLRKHFRQFDNAHAANAHNTTKKETHCKCSQHNQKRNALQIKCVWLCCEHLQRVSLFVCVVSICSVSLFVCVVSVCSVSLFVCVVSVCSVSLFVCVVSVCTICCQTDEDVFLICWWFFYLHVFSEVVVRWALSATVHYSLCSVNFLINSTHESVFIWSKIQ